MTTPKEPTKLLSWNTELRAVGPSVSHNVPSATSQGELLHDPETGEAYIRETTVLEDGTVLPAVEYPV